MANKINETHLCTLKRSKSDDKIYMEIQQMDFEFQSEFNDMNIMHQNNALNVLDMERYVESGPLAHLLRSYNYCHFPNEPYQELQAYKWTEPEAYFKKIASLKSLNELNSFINEKKQELVRRLQKGKTAYMLQNAYERCKQDSNVLAHSHRGIGFNFPEFKIGEEFDIIFKSNFGFGNSSYFYTNIRYKNIDILPYSHWIKYSIANKSDIVRFTRAHDPKNDSWEEAMNIATHYYNESIKDPESFEKKWIIGECESLVEGLINLLSQNKTFEVLRSRRPGDVVIKLEGLDLLKFQGEKISGALTFLKRMEGLKSISDKVNGYIQTIINLNTNILPELKTKVNSLTLELASYQREMDTLDPKRQAMWLQILDYSVKRRELEVVPTDGDSYQSLEAKRENLFLVRFPEYNCVSKEYSMVVAEHDRVYARILSNKNYIDAFTSYIGEIELQLSLG